MNWSQDRFNEIENALLPFLSQAGFKRGKLTFIPVSGLCGENLIARSSPALNSWYSGPTLIEKLGKPFWNYIFFQK